MKLKQIDCFKINMLYFKFLGLWPGEIPSRFYECYSKMIFVFFFITYNLITTVNFFFIPKQLDLFVEEMLFYFTEWAIVSKAAILLYKHDAIKDILDLVESDMFQPETEDTLKIVKNAKKSTKRYFTIMAVVSHVANLVHVLSPLIAHIFLKVNLALPVCSYSFMPENIKETLLIYPIYLYQSLGMHFHMLVSVNVDTFILGLMILLIAQLEVLNCNLRRLTDDNKSTKHVSNKEERVFKEKLHKCIVHFLKIEEFCSSIEKVFGECFFVQFSASSCIICVVLFRFTLPAPTAYYVFLSTYMIAMLIPVLMPTWFGTRIMEASSALSIAIYNCDWTSRPQEFKRSMMLFVERMNRPLAITACKMFPLLLTTFTKIMNTAYSFLTLLRNMQARES